MLQILNCKETGFVLELFVISHLLSISENKPSPLRRNNSSLFIIFIIITVLKTPLWYQISYWRWAVFSCIKWCGNIVRQPLMLQICNLNNWTLRKNKEETEAQEGILPPALYFILFILFHFIYLFQCLWAGNWSNSGNLGCLRSHRESLWWTQEAKAEQDFPGLKSSSESMFAGTQGEICQVSYCSCPSVLSMKIWN